MKPTSSIMRAEIASVPVSTSPSGHPYQHWRSQSAVRRCSSNGAAYFGASRVVPEQPDGAFLRTGRCGTRGEPATVLCHWRPPFRGAATTGWCNFK